jgi:hypothetical protein
MVVEGRKDVVPGQRRGSRMKEEEGRLEQYVG